MFYHTVLLCFHEATCIERSLYINEKAKSYISKAFNKAWTRRRCLTHAWINHQSMFIVLWPWLSSGWWMAVRSRKLRAYRTCDYFITNHRCGPLKEQLMMFISGRIELSILVSIIWCWIIKNNLSSIVVKHVDNIIYIS